MAKEIDKVTLDADVPYVSLRAIYPNTAVGKD